MREPRTRGHRETSGKMVLVSTSHGGPGTGSPTRNSGEAWSVASGPEDSGMSGLWPPGLGGARVCVCVCACVRARMCVCMFVLLCRIHLRGSKVRRFPTALSTRKSRGKPKPGALTPNIFLRKLLFLSPLLFFFRESLTYPT